MPQLSSTDTPPEVGHGHTVAHDAMNHASHAANEVNFQARDVVRSPWFSRMARLGYAAKGLVYIIIGWLAFATAIRAGGRTTDPQGAITTIYNHPLGKFALVIIVVGFVGYSLWQFACALWDPDRDDQGAKENVKRIGYAVVGVSYLGFALAALRLLTQHSAPRGSNASTQDWTARLLAAPGGVVLVVLVGLIVLGVAVALATEAWKESFKRHFPLDSMSEPVRKATLILGRVGLGAQSAVFAVIGIFLIDAALRHNPHKAQGLAGALAALAAQPFGPVLLSLVALGLIAYGVYGFVEARYRRIHV